MTSPGNRRERCADGSLFGVAPCRLRRGAAMAPKEDAVKVRLESLSSLVPVLLLTSSLPTQRSAGADSGQAALQACVRRAGPCAQQSRGACACCTRAMPPSGPLRRRPRVRVRVCAWSRVSSALRETPFWSSCSNNVVQNPCHEPRQSRS